jgi:regulator of sigma E protease
MRVERFSLFFGPLLMRKKWGETEYGVGPIPLGGYVRITGMNPHERFPEQERLDADREQLEEVRTELRESPEGLARREELRTQERELSNRIGAGEAQLAAIRQRAYYNQPVWKRVVVILAGPAVNLLLAFVIVWALFVSNGQPVTTKRVAVVEAAPASRFLKQGDEIVSVDGVSGSAEAIHNAIIRHRCPGQLTNGCVASTAAHVVVRRGGHELSFNIRPRYNASLHEMLLGFGFGQKQVAVGAGQAASLSVSNLWYVTKATVSAIGHVVNPKPQQRLSSVVGAYKVTQQSFAQDASQALWVLALISLSLAIINLFPFLPLDGGHVFWALAEKVRGKRIPFEVMERASAAGFVLIIIVFVIGLSNDISTLSGSGFNVR